GLTTFDAEASLGDQLATVCQLAGLQLRASTNTDLTLVGHLRRLCSHIALHHQPAVTVQMIGADPRRACDSNVTGVVQPLQIGSQATVTDHNATVVQGAAAELHPRRSV